MEDGVTHFRWVTPFFYAVRDGFVAYCVFDLLFDEACERLANVLPHGCKGNIHPYGLWACF